MNIKTKKIVLVAASLLFMGSMVTFAATSTFEVSLSTTGVNSQPPTVPTGLVAVPMSTSQIDLSWVPSTGYLYSVAGYQVFRDSTFIATTTSPSYIDADLAPSTTYTYEVTAFDTAMNISSSSLPVSTTTLEIPTVIPAVETFVSSAASSIPSLTISKVEIDPSTSQATVSFETNLSTRTKLFWGLTSEYESVSLSGLFYGTSHQLEISGLMPFTKYFLRIQVTDIFGRSAFVDTSFTTGLSPQQNPLPNPSDFTAIGYSDHVGLSWIDPSDPRFAKVRIVRNESFYPKDQNDGVPVYEGSASKFNDTKVEQGKTYYYAIFSIGNDGTFSSGALAQALVSGPGGGTTNTNGDPFARIQNSMLVDPMIEALTFDDFEFLQDGQILSHHNRTVSTDAGKNLTIRLAYSKVPEILKNIAFTVADPEDSSKVFTFLLRVNHDKTDYESTIGPLDRSARFDLSIIVLDFQNKGLKRLNGAILANKITAALGTGERVDFLSILLVLIIIAILLFILSRFKKSEKKYQWS